MNIAKKIGGSLIAFFLLIIMVIPTEMYAQVKKPAAKPPAAKKAPSVKPSTDLKPAADKKPSDIKSKSGDGRTNIGGNNVNIDNSNTNVNINVDNSKDVRIHNEKNTVVRHNNINSYHNPPYRWGGHRYYCYHPYYYHPYRPFYWGPVWHPWGFFIATLAATAILVTVNNAQYHYDQGVWYQPSNSGYVVVSAPVGGTISTLPPGNQPVIINNTTNYYYGGSYYEKGGSGYTVVAPPAGAVVDNLGEGGEEVIVGDQTYVKFGDTYYAPVLVDGQDKYEVVQIEDEE